MVGIKEEDVRNNIGNSEVKELICTTHRHELRGRYAGKGGCRVHKGEKNRTTVIPINKIYLKLYLSFLKVLKVVF